VRPYVTRIVLDLDRPMPFTLTTGTGTVTVALQTGAGASANEAPTTPAPAAPPSGARDEMSGHVPSQGRADGDRAGGRPREGTPIPVATAPGGDGSGPPAAQAHPTGGHAVAPGGAAANRNSDGSKAPANGDGAAPTQPAPAPQEEAPVAPEPLALPPLPEFSDRPGAFHILGATYDEQDGTGRITIQATRPFTYVVHRFVYPDRLAIDIPGGVFRPRRRDLEIGTDAVRNIVITQFHLDPNLTRVEIHLNHKAAYALLVVDGGRSLVLTLADSGQPGPRGQAVIIDPGHGGDDSGAVGPHGVREADVTLSIGRLTAQALERQGVHAVLTRTADTTVPLEERPDLAVRNGGVVFVSIHANASRDPAAIGTETYYKTPESQALAALVQAEVVRALGEPDRGVRTADFYVIVNTPMPAILVEVAFISNPREEAMLRDPAVQRRVAEAIARGVLKFLAADRQAAVP
jgi:N-acetylmuramoyl-L-alanine amidase